MCPFALDRVLAIIFNNCTNIGYFPAQWKDAKMVPIPKRGNSREVADFRPISMLSNIGKLYERVILDWIEKHCSANAIIPSFQFGFEKGHSTEQALIVFSETIIRSLRRQESTVCLDLDHSVVYPVMALFFRGKWWG